MIIKTLSRTTAFQKVKANIIEKVAKGELLPGEKLFDERALARSYNVSRDTIRRALKSLSEEQVVERIQGSGTYIKKTPTFRSNKIEVIYYSTENRGDEYTFSSLTHLTRHALSWNYEIVFRSFENERELKAGLEDINNRSDLAGGVVLSVNTPEDIKFIHRHCRIPLVAWGDMNTQDRMRPIIDQVTGSSYQIGYQGTQELMKRGCKSPAIVVMDRRFIWNRDAIEGFCDASGISASSDSIYTFHEIDQAVLKSPDVYEMTHWSEKIVSQWLQTKNIPDGLFVSDLWLMRLLVSALKKMGRKFNEMPGFCIWIHEGTSLSQIDQSVRAITIRPSIDKNCERVFKRLEEKNAGDTVIKLEVVEDVIIDGSCWK
jgi:DNA-binding transcriptional regulator YhcF (GntR family)